MLEIKKQANMKGITSIKEIRPKLEDASNLAKVSLFYNIFITEC